MMLHACLMLRPTCAALPSAAAFATLHGEAVPEAARLTLLR
jgi:hypothetical protein